VSLDLSLKCLIRMITTSELDPKRLSLMVGY